MKLMPKLRFAIIDYLRLTAAVCVCVSHVIGACRNTDRLLAPLGKVFEYTTVFRVPLLFTISGFVVYLSIRNKPQELSSVYNFLIRRWVWIVLPLFLALCFTYGYEKLLYVCGFPNVPQKTTLEALSNILCVTSFTNTRRWIIPTWSLAYELQYYLIIALAWLSSFTTKNRAISDSLLCITLLTLLLLSLIVDRMYQIDAFGIWHFRWFALGLLAGLRFTDTKYAWMFRFSVLLVGTDSYIEGGVIPVLTKLLLLTGILVFIETDGLKSVHSLLRTSPLLGTISFLIYLFHWPIGSHSDALVQLCQFLGLHDDYWPMFAILFPLSISVLIARPVYRLCDWATHMLMKLNRSGLLSPVSVTGFVRK
jgi:peptidoglycan/LPS O-acetylase OafA/YrhL